MLASFSADEQAVRDTIVDEHGLSVSARPPRSRTGGRCERGAGELILAPYQFAWIQG